MRNSFKKIKVQLDLLTDIDMLLEVEYVMLFIDMWKLMTNTRKIMIKTKNRYILGRQQLTQMDNVAKVA